MLHCIYHDNCADGFAAAWAVWAIHGSTDAVYTPAEYNRLPPKVAGHDVVIVDFSYPEETLRVMALEANSILVLDHHKTARDALQSFNPPIGGGYDDWLAATDQGMIENIAVLFDMERSGAGMAWDYFHPGMPRPRLLEHVEDRDLWRFNHTASKPLHAALTSYPCGFELWDSFMMNSSSPSWLDGFRVEGESILRKQDKDIRAAIESDTRRIIMAGHDVPVLNVPYPWMSDAGHLLCRGEKFAALYTDTPHGRKFSLRSDGNFDVSAIAKMFEGGGGHVPAAGFTVPYEHELVLFGKHTG